MVRLSWNDRNLAGVPAKRESLTESREIPRYCRPPRLPDVVQGNSQFVIETDAEGVYLRRALLPG